MPGSGAGRSWLDLRLAAGAAAGWLAVVIGVGRAASTTFEWALGAAGVGAAGLYAAYRGQRLAAVVAMVAFCVALVLLPLAARLARAHESPLATLARERVAVTAELTVAGDPRLLAARGPAGAPRTAVDAQLDSLLVAGRRVGGVGGSVLILAPAAAWRDVLPGQRVRLDGVLQPALSDDLLAAVLVAAADPVGIGRPPWWQRVAGDVRSSLRDASAGLPGSPRGLLPGLVEGDTTGLDPVLAERFRAAGLTHLVAVSGTNCTIVVGACLLVLRRFGCGPRTCAVAGAAVLLMFVVVARPSPSVLRAAVMAAIALFSLASGRQQDGVPLVSAAVLGLLLWRPALAVDLGFAMSVLATLALLIVAPGWAATLRRRRVPPVLAESLAVAAAAHLVTAPLIAVISGSVSIVAIPANVLAEPVVALATVLGFCAAVTAPLSLTVGSMFAQLAGWPCRWLAWVAEFFGGLQGARLPWPGGMVGGALLAGATCALVWLARMRRTRRIVAGGLVVCVLLEIPVRTVVSGWPPSGWIFVACDVGQGDGLVLPVGPHTAVVVDAGPDPVAIDRCLHDLAITQVPLVVLSHYHLDHVGGLAGVFHGRRVLQVIAGPLREPASGVAIVTQLLTAHRMTAGSVSVGQRTELGAVGLDVLAPLAVYRGTRSDPNNSSIVLRATVDGERILLPGDAEVEAQQALLAAGTDLRADVLKVPHHGSAYSDRAFIAAVGAKLGVISVGLHNDYGHPSPMLLAMLSALGVPVRRTDRDGTVAVVAHDGALSTVVHTATAWVGSGSRRTVSDDPIGASAHHATMTSCLIPTRTPIVRPRREPVPLIACRPSFCSSATRSCSSRAPSSRSPPPRVEPTPRLTSGNAAAPSSTWRSSTSCSARRCSVAAGCLSCRRLRI